MINSKVKKLLKKSYLKMIENSIDSNTYRNFYVEIKCKELDVLEDEEQELSEETFSFSWMSFSEKKHDT